MIWVKIIDLVLNISLILIGLSMGLFIAALFIGYKNTPIKYVSPPVNCRGEEMIDVDSVVDDIEGRCRFDE